MKKLQLMKGASAQGGVMLLEALVAILIFSIGIVAVMGMQAVSITQVSQSKYRTDASYLANQVIGMMWADSLNLAQYANAGGPRTSWDNAIKSTLPQGTGTVVLNGTQAVVTITWKMPDDVVTHRYQAVANVNTLCTTVPPTC